MTGAVLPVLAALVFAGAGTAALASLVLSLADLADRPDLSPEFPRWLARLAADLLDAEPIRSLFPVDRRTR